MEKKYCYKKHIGFICTKQNQWICQSDFQNEKQPFKNDPFWTQQRIYDCGFDQKGRGQRLQDCDGKSTLSE